MDFSGCINDESFGPAVDGCRGNFDFTIKFERIIFNLIPTTLFIAISIPRLLWLRRRPVIVTDGSKARSLKLIAITIYGVIQFALLVLSITKSRTFEALLISSSAVTFASAFCIFALSCLEHSRSPRPAVALNAYLFLTILLDITQTRTLWLASFSFDEITFSRLLTTSVVIKALLIVLESQSKIKWLRWDTKEHSPEESSGLYSLGAFAWLNKLFLMGYGRLLTLNDLYPLDQALASNILQPKFTNVLLASPRNRKNGLAIATARALTIPLLLPVAPRIVLTAFQFCQPFLLNTLLSYLQTPREESSHNIGHSLIGATALVYTGIAFSGAVYWYLQERAVYMARGMLAGAVYRKSLEARTSAADSSAALTLMSTDIERIIQGFLSIHELWANILEVALACWLLSRQIGVSFVSPLVVIILCVVLISFLGKFAGPRQKVWMENIEQRVGLTSKIIGQMKSLKISGLVTPVEELIQEMRVKELKTGARFRMIITWSVIVGFTPLCISPVVTFAFAARSLDINTIFTSMSYLLLLSNPLSILFQLIPGFIAAFACLTRIQQFLEEDSRSDFRTTPFCRSTQNVGIEDSVDQETMIKPDLAMSIVGGNFGWQEDKLVLQNINLDIVASRLTIVIGPVASGKSTLCKVILGEVPVAKGKVSMGHAFNEARYHEVIEASMLLQDLANLPEGDQTNVGSKGITLSGGQKSRVCIARALYLDASFLLFDDILSGLDADTEEQVFRAIGSTNGLLRQRKATTVLCTHSVKHLPFADHIVALGSNGEIVEQGTYEELMSNEDGYVYSLGVKESKGDKFDDPTTVTASKQREMLEIAPKMAGVSHDEEQERTLGDSAVFRHYFSRVKKWNLAALIIFSIGSGFFFNFNVIWLKFWSQDVESSRPRHPSSFYIGLYALLQVSTLFCLFMACVVVLIATIQVVGAKIHKEALATVFNAPLQFFATTDTGVVTNHFSQDMTLMDGSLPLALLNTSIITANCIGVAAVLATSSQFLIITYPLLAAILWGIQRFYLRTSRQIRLLDLEAKSPLYTHFIDTMEGLVTFRAFGWAEDGISLNERLLDTSQRPAYLLAMIQRWLGLTLQLVVAGLAVIFVTLATQLRSNSAFTGASLVTLMSFGDQLSLLVQQYTLLETSIGAVSRLKTFSEKTVSESLAEEDVIPPREWPLESSIEINGVSASYDAQKHEPSEQVTGNSDYSGTGSRKLALKNISLSIAPGEKIAICGRSGSGKSSTILLLLKILDPLAATAQNISIGSAMLHKIDRKTLRQRIIAVPQEPVFLPDGTTFQTNLDPFVASTEAECRAVFERVGLWGFITEHGGLAAGLMSGMLSVGQKQLFNLARAVLRARVRARELVIEFGEKGPGSTPSGILLLDEVSSSVDQETDRAMQSIIHAEFVGYTVVMVSHRLEMVIAFDRVVVMERGEIVETGPPKELSEKEGGWFRELWLAGSNG